jgi:hypothetical protein
MSTAAMMSDPMTPRKRAVESSKLGAMNIIIPLLSAHFELQVVGGRERVVLVEDAAEEDHEQAEARSLREVVAADAACDFRSVRSMA